MSNLLIGIIMIGIIGVVYWVLFGERKYREMVGK